MHDLWTFSCHNQKNQQVVALEVDSTCNVQPYLHISGASLIVLTAVFGRPIGASNTLGESLQVASPSTGRSSRTSHGSHDSTSLLETAPVSLRALMDRLCSFFLYFSVEQHSSEECQVFSCGFSNNTEHFALNVQELTHNEVPCQGALHSTDLLAGCKESSTRPRQTFRGML